MSLLAVALLMETLDVLTYAIHPLTAHYEANPLIVGLGTTAPLAKLLLLILVVSVAVLLTEVGRYQRARSAMLWVAVVAGGVGAASNIL